MHELINLKVVFVPESDTTQRKGRILFYGRKTKVTPTTQTSNQASSITTGTIGPDVVNTSQTNPVITTTSDTIEYYDVVYCFDQQGIIYSCLPEDVIVRHEIKGGDF